MTFEDVLFDLKEALNINSDDRSFDIPDSYILSTYGTNRAFILTNTYNKSGRILDPDITQRLLIPMEPVDKGVCGIETDCLINRSIDPLPSRPITTHDKPMLTISAPLIGSKQIRLITEGVAGNVGNSPFTSRTYYVFYAGDGHLYIMSKDRRVLGIKTLMAVGVFEDPQAVADSSVCDDADCTRYPIKEALHKQISDITLKELSIKYQIPQDSVNDATGDMRQGVAQAKQ